ncbi:MAG TPA: ABC transporter permease [Thermoanaerobaculia bacterium]|nr:ABC transporter permease [Thermoanaerobaculia bacterium]
MTESLSRNVRFALRALRREPLSTLLIVLALALGIGGNVAIFSVVKRVLLEPLPYRESYRILLIMDSNVEAGLPRFGISPPNFADYRAQSTSFEALSAYVNSTASYTDGDEPLRLAGLEVTHGFFEVLGIRPLIGRTFTAQDDTPGAPRVVLLSSGLWHRLFGGETGIIGHPIRLDGEAYTVIGVMPPDFQTLSDMETGNDYWKPLAMDLASQKRSRHYLVGLGRLRQGVTVETARTDLQNLAARLGHEYAATNEGWSVHVDRLQESLVGEIRPALLILWGAVAFVLLIACVNVANLMLARLASREWEIAIRGILGARSWHIVGQLLTECVVLALAGGCLGTLAGSWLIQNLLALYRQALPTAGAIRLDGKMALFGVALSVLAAILFGTLPAFRSSRLDLKESLQRKVYWKTARGRGWTRDALIVAEVTLAAVVLICAGLLLRSFALLAGTSPGFEAERVLTAEVSLPADRYAPESEKPLQFFRTLLDRFSAMPDVEHAGLVSVLPLSSFSFSGSISIEGQTPASEEQAPVVTKYIISPDYFRAMGIRLQRGRPFDDRDIDGATPVAIVSETAAQRFWPGENPLGKRITSDNLQAGAGDDPIHWLTIVGVVSDVRTDRLADAGGPTAYYPYMQNPLASMALVIRTCSDPHRSANLLRKAVWSLDPRLPVYNVEELEQHVARSIAQPRFSSLLVGVFAAVGLLLASFGVFGVVSQGVAQHMRDMGIRMALGARRSSLVISLVSRGMLPVVIGLGCGVLASLFLTRYLQSLLYGLTRNDFLTFAAAAGVLGSVALVACLIPACRIVRVDPMTVLRED